MVAAIILIVIALAMIAGGVSFMRSNNTAVWLAGVHATNEGFKMLVAVVAAIVSEANK